MTTSEYARADRPLSLLLDAMPESAWSQPSGCDGWTARDVLAHMIDTQRDFLTERGVEPGNRPALDSAPALGWRQHADAVMSLLSDEAVSSLSFQGFFGPTTVGETIDRFYVWDMLVHRWDIAQAAALDARFTDAELDRIDAGAEGFGEALYMEGICRPAVAVPAGSPRSTEVLGRLGRVARPARDSRVKSM